MKGYILKRLGGFVFVLFGISILTFVIMHISPVDSAEAYIRKTSLVPSEEALQKIREEMGLNKPLPIQYLSWVKNLLKLDLGTSYITNESVLNEFKSRFPVTLKLVTAAVFIILLISIPLGVISAVYKNKFLDHLIRILALLGVSLPNYLIGFLLIYVFGVYLKLLPIMGEGTARQIILPAFTLAIPVASSYIRMLRVNMLENMNMDYIKYARARGVEENLVIFKHVLINALLPMITILGQSIAYMMAGIAIVETIFSWPGIGKYCIDAIYNRDYPVIQSYVLLLATIFVFCNLLTDIINMAIDPRILKEGADV